MGVVAWAGALALMVQGAAPAPVPLMPTGKWQVAFEENLCAMAHEFGAGVSAVTLLIKPVPLSAEMDVLLVRASDRSATTRGIASATLRPSDRVLRGDYVGYAAQPSRAVRLQLDRVLLAELGQATELTIAADDTVFALTIPSIANAVRALDQCEAALLTRWGVDPALRNRPAPRLRGTPAQFFGPGMYPASALRERIEGRVVVLLKVGANGRVDSCRVVTKSRSSDLDAATCAGARRVRFSPATGADGAPMASAAVLPVRWMLPTR